MKIIINNVEKFRMCQAATTNKDHRYNLAYIKIDPNGTAWATEGRVAVKAKNCAELFDKEFVMPVYIEFPHRIKKKINKILFDLNTRIAGLYCLDSEIVDEEYVFKWKDSAEMRYPDLETIMKHENINTFMLTTWPNVGNIPMGIVKKGLPDIDISWAYISDGTKIKLLNTPDGLTVLANVLHASCDSNMKQTKVDMEKIDYLSTCLESAIAAIGGMEWQKELCGCDSEVAFQCQYCVMHEGLVESIALIKRMKDFV